jgi:hypothetical protein
MILTIYFKNGTGSKDGHVYDFSKEQYQKFREDFEAFLKLGTPRGSTYVCRQHDEAGNQPVEGLIIEFDSIAFVNLNVSMASIQTRAQQIEIAKMRVKKDSSKDK